MTEQAVCNLFLNYLFIYCLISGGGGGSSDDQAGLKFPAPHTPTSNPLTPASPHGILQSPPAPNIRQPSPAPPQGQPTPSPGFMAPSPVNNPSLGKYSKSSRLELLVMSSSWKILARAELGHFNFRAETELTILTICMSKNRNFFSNFSMWQNLETKIIFIFKICSNFREI